MQLVETFVMNPLSLAIRINSSIFCYPYPGVQQSEYITFKCLQSLSILFKICPLILLQRLKRNSVPGEMELILKFSMSSIPKSL